MSIATITTLGFGSYSTVNSAVLLGYLPGVIPPPPVTNVIVPGVADKRKRDREEYYRRRRLNRNKQTRQLLEKIPQVREQQVNVLNPPAVVDLSPQQQLFGAQAAPRLPPAPMAKSMEALPLPMRYDDEDDLFMLTE